MPETNKTMMKQMEACQRNNDSYQPESTGLKTHSRDAIPLFLEQELGRRRSTEAAEDMPIFSNVSNSLHKLSIGTFNSMAPSSPLIRSP